MPTDTTITRYGSTGANQGFAIVVRPDGPWVRYEDHERALTAAHAARDAALKTVEFLTRNAEAHALAEQQLSAHLTAALLERDEARAAIDSALADAIMVSACLRENGTDPIAWADSVEQKLRNATNASHA